MIPLYELSLMNRNDSSAFFADLREPVSLQWPRMQHLEDFLSIFVVFRFLNDKLHPEENWGRVIQAGLTVWRW